MCKRGNPTNYTRLCGRVVRRSQGQVKRCEEKLLNPSVNACKGWQSAERTAAERAMVTMVDPDITSCPHPKGPDSSVLSPEHPSKPDRRIGGPNSLAKYATSGGRYNPYAK
jgi:hypothetical protein